MVIAVKNKTMFQILLFILLTQLGIHSDEICSSPLTNEQIIEIDKISLRDVPKGAPGIACGIVIDGQIVYTKYAGYARLEDSLLIDENSRFNIASNAKQFVAIMALELINQGKLSLEDDIRNFYPDFYPGINRPITIRNLLTHSSGIRDVYDLWNLKGMTWWEHSFSNNDVIMLLSNQKELNFIPGSQYSYSNSNYILLAEIIGKVEGELFSSLSDDFFNRLGMLDTSFEVDYENISQPIASPYFNFNTWTGYEWIWNAVGDGNLFSSMKDQLRWEQIIQGYVTDVLSKKIIKLSQLPIEGSEIKSYGYGLEISDYNDYQHLFHHGGTGAMKATLSRFPSESISIITLSNSGKTDVVDQNRKIANVLLSIDTDLKSYLTEPETVGDYVSEDEILGVYLTENEYAFNFVRKEDGLYLSRSGRNDVLLQRESDNTFNQVYDPAFKQEFVRNGEGVLLVTAYYNTHGPFTLRKVEVEWEDFDFNTLNGTYLNDEIDLELNINYINGTDYMINVGDYETKGMLLNRAKMLVDGYSLDIEIIQGDKTIYLNSDRAKRVRFKYGTK